MISHVVSKDAMHIFEAEMIGLYLIKPGSENVMHRFTARSNNPTSFDMLTTKSLASETIKNGKVFRMNNLSKNANFSAEAYLVVAIDQYSSQYDNGLYSVYQ
jgi:hypothetical protein